LKINNFKNNLISAKSLFDHGNILATTTWYYVCSHNSIQTNNAHDPRVREAVAPEQIANIVTAIGLDSHHYGVYILTLHKIHGCDFSIQLICESQIR
jgi:hypothetical protein